MIWMEEVVGVLTHLKCDGKYFYDRRRLRDVFVWHENIVRWIGRHCRK